MEGDEVSIVSGSPLYSFQSTPSAWRETAGFYAMSCYTLFQSTPSAWRETFARTSNLQALAFQSTPSAWRETSHVSEYCRLQQISIHSLRMEGDFFSLHLVCYDAPFQSTPSAWRETACVLTPFRRYAPFQSTPSAWRETHSFLINH